ncbi:MAG TPA: hypothetical protein VMV01_18775 [Planctomycetota bacterium]|jgi:hypothetical protein|nr:hypothetical protein [Planctomycetota bacterium]HZJ70426.1 hypothetical protein [Planctomycetota bacterium]
MNRSALLATAALAVLAASPAAPERAKVGKVVSHKFESPVANGLGVDSVEALRGTPTVYEFWRTT